MADQSAVPIRFPTSAGLILAASLSLHLAALVEVAFAYPIEAATAFLCGEFLLSLALLRLYDGKWVFQDIRFFFVIFFFLYGGTLPLVVLAGLSGDQPGIAGAAFMYGTAFFGFNLVQWWYRQGWHDVPPHVFARFKPTSLNGLVLLGGFGFVVAYAVVRGVDLSLTIDRSQVRFLATQMWVVTMFAINGLVMYMFLAWSGLSRTGRIALVASVLLFVGFQVAMGNRRDFLPMLV
ncbi:MAG TPA: hypothetical protein VHM24_11400, partial [Gemmatimonadaceae bacterium]|nr:hypothetical protein [Gemmatimonadaceae bacterium]